MGGTSPTFPGKSQQSWFTEKTGSAVALLCPAQAYPAPNVR